MSGKIVQMDHYITYIQDEQHYNEVLKLVGSVRETLWIGTADIKDLYVKMGSDVAPFLFILSTLIKRGISVRLIHAKKPGERFQLDFKKFPVLKNGLEMTLCPRVHFKMFILDNKVAYIGSANLTGAGVGMKGTDKRNFEAGILTNVSTLVEGAVEHFDSVWRGDRCKSCKRKEYCPIPIK